VQLVTYVHDSPPWKIADHAVHIPAAGSSQFGGTLFSRQRSSCWTALSRTSWQISPTRSARCGATTQLCCSRDWVVPTCWWLSVRTSEAHS
jgi:hypothetical protein